MAKTKISEFSSTPGNNTDIDGINIAEGCAPSGINNAIRELMSQLKDFQAGTAGDSFNGPVGATTAAAGAFTTLTTSGAVTHNAGTANGVAYLNGSKVLTTGSALTFDGTRLTVNTESASETDVARFQASNGGDIQFLDIGADATNNLVSFDVTGSSSGAYVFRSGGNERMRLTSAGDLGIGTSSPGARVDAAGNIRVSYAASAANASLIANNTSSAASSTSQIIATNDASRALRIQYSSSGGIGGSAISGGFTGEMGQIFTDNNYPLSIGTGGVARLNIDTSGNLGLGVTPSAWASVALQVGSYAGLTQNNSLGSAELTYNCFRSSGATWNYINSDTATRYRQWNSAHAWFIAPSGTAGNAISFTQAMTLTATGNLGVGSTSPGARISLGTSAQSSTDAACSIRLYDEGGINGNNYGFGIDGNTGRLAYTAGNSGFHAWFTANTERARIDSSGNLLVGTTSGSTHILQKNVTRDAGNVTVEFTSTSSSTSQIWYGVSVYGANAANAATKVGRDSVTSRSINAGGTVNASGADYAEYMTKAGDFTFSKGDVVGINADGKLTNVFADAVSFCVKSTDPSYVGGDVWGNEDSIGKRPSKDATDEEKAAYADALEAARQKVDRIAFAGQVPVNVMGATPGQYIVPVDENGAIKGIAKNEADMTLAEYIKAVGKVIAVKEDGRAFIIVKVA